MRKTALTLLLMMCAAWARADVAVRDAWARGTVPGQTASGAFMELRSSEDAKLLSVASPIAGVVEVHQMRIDNGVMKMRAIAELDLPAGQTVALKPGGYHIMLMDLKRQLKQGDSVPLRLTLEGRDKKLSTLDVQAEVRELTRPPMEHAH